jgi:hypothetical protein
MNRFFLGTQDNEKFIILEHYFGEGGMSGE